MKAANIYCKNIKHGLGPRKNEHHEHMTNFQKAKNKWTKMIASRMIHFFGWFIVDIVYKQGRNRFL